MRIVFTFFQCSHNIIERLRRALRTIRRLHGTICSSIQAQLHTFVALQRAIQRDQVLRPHLRRVKRGGVAADYFECGGDAGYRRSSSPSSSGDGGSSRTRGHRGVSSP